MLRLTPDIAANTHAHIQTGRAKLDRFVVDVDDGGIHLAGDERRLVAHVRAEVAKFLAEVKGMPQRNLAVELLRKLLNDELKRRSRTNLVQSRTFSEIMWMNASKWEYMT